MNKLNTDLIINILEHLEYSELMRYLDCKAINNKNQLFCNHNELSDLITDKLDQKQRFIIDNYPNILINSLGGLDNFVKFPFLKFEKKFLNSTAYIDNIKDKDMKFPIMIGKDILNRPFISIKTKIEGDVEVNVLFQRLPCFNGNWCIGKWSNFTNNPLFSEGGYLLNNFENIHNYSLGNLKRLVNNTGSINYVDFLGNHQKLEANLVDRHLIPI